MVKINPRVDIAFKKIFGVEENTDLLISLINSIVDEEDQVEEITLMNPYMPKNFRDAKLSILDIKAKGICGKRYNIEIQISDDADYDKRALYYWARLYTEQLKVGEDYSLLSKAIGIHILNFTSIPDVDKYHNVFHIKEKESEILYFRDLELHTIELKKFSKNSSEELPDVLKKIQNSLDMWVAFLTRHDLLNKDDLPAAINTPVLKKELNVLDIMSFGEEERDAYEDHLKWFMVEANTLKKSFAEGKIKGFAEGEIKGRLEGQREALLQIARKMSQQGSSQQNIAEITGLSNEELNTLYH